MALPKLPKLPSDVKLLTGDHTEAVTLHGVTTKDVVMVVNFDKFIHWLVDCTIQRQKENDGDDTWWKEGDKPPWEQ